MPILSQTLSRDTAVIIVVNGKKGGGAEVVAQNQYDLFTKWNNCTTVLVYSKEASSEEDEHHYLGNASLFNKVRRFNKIIRRYRQKHDRVVVIAHLPYSIFISRFTTGVKNVVWCHGPFHRVFSRAMIGKLLLWRRTIITISKSMSEEYNEVMGSLATIDFCYNPLDFAKIIERADQELPIVPDEEEYIIFVGRLERQKRIDVLLEAMDQLPRNINLLIFGVGSLENSLKKQARSMDLINVKFMGWTNNPFPYIRKAKMLVLSSDYEGLPTILLESLALQTPAISTDCKTGPNEILRGILANYLVPTGNPTKLAEKIGEVWGKPYEIDDSILTPFSSESIERKLMKIVDEV